MIMRIDGYDDRIINGIRRIISVSKIKKIILIRLNTKI